MRGLLFLVHCLLSAGVLLAQWPFSYQITLPGTELNFVPERVEQLANGNYAINGTLEGTDGFWFYGVEMDAAGNIQDHYLHGIAPADDPMYAAPPLRCSDGGMLYMYKATPGIQNHVCFTKVDAQGGLAWNKCVDDTLYAHFPQIRNALMEHDGSYLAYARYHDVPVNVGWENILFQLSTAGDVQQILLFGEGATTSDLAYAIVPAANNGLLTAQLLHPVGSLSIYHGISIQRWSPSLTMEWSRQYDLGYSHYLEDLITLSNGDLLLIAGKTETTLGPRRSVLCRLDGAGNILWTRVIQHDEIVVTGARELANGTLVCYGWTVLDQEQECMLAMLSADGSFLHGRILDGSSALFPLDASLTNDGAGVLLSANMVQGGSVVLAMDTTFTEACGSSPFTWPDSLITATSFDRPLQVTSAILAVLDAPTLDQNWTFLTQDTCLPTAIGNTDHTDEVHVYPNPASDRLKIIFPKVWQNSGSTSLRMTNVQGTQVMSATITNAVTNVDVSDLASGVYTLIASDGSRTTHSIVVIE